MKKGLMMTLDTGRKKTGQRKIHETENHLTGRTRGEQGKLWDGKKCKEQFMDGMTGRRHGLDFARGEGGRSTKWYVCGTGDGGTAKIEITGKMNRVGVARD